jgi:hypothetical protein
MAPRTASQAERGRLAYLEGLLVMDGRLSQDHEDELWEFSEQLDRSELPELLLIRLITWKLEGRR